MKLKDGRKLTNAELHDRRKQAVLLHKKGETRGEIGRLLGAHRNTVGNWISAWKKRGASALKPRIKGVSKGSGRSLTPEQVRYIRLSDN